MRGLCPTMSLRYHNPMPMQKNLSLITSLVAFAALTLQLILITQKMTSEGATTGQALWRYLGFFTILTNIGVLLVSAAITVNPQVIGPRLRLSTVSAIAFVGLVYSIALRGTWVPTGWQAVADHALHDATPLLFLITWLASGHGALRWRDALFASVAPLVYCLYALARGSLDGWYAYWFLDPRSLNLGRMALSIAALLVAFEIVALFFIAADRRLGRSNINHG